METMNIVNKLSVKTMNLDPASLTEKLEENKIVVIARMYGQITDYKIGKSKFSTDDLPKEDVKFRGTFEGVNLVTGEVFNSGVCFLPGNVTNVLRAAVDSKADDEIGVQFGVEIGAKKVKRRDGTWGYEFTAAVPKNPEAADPLAAMRETMKALPGGYAPSTTVTPAIENKSAEKAAAKKG